MGKQKPKFKTTFTKPNFVRPIGPLYPCSKCGRKKPALAMTHDKHRIKQIGSWCKDCQKAYMKKYRLEHKEEIKAQYQVWVEGHREQRRASIEKFRAQDTRK